MFKNKNWRLAALAALLTLVAGCHGGHTQNSTDMRAVNAVIDAEPLDVLVDNDVKFGGLAFGATSPFSEFSSGGREVTLRSASNQAVFFDKNLNFGSGANYTLVIYGTRSAMSALQLTDDIVSPDTAPASGNFKIRAVGASADSGPVDVYVTQAADISNSPATIGSISFTSVSGYSESAAGSYRIVLTVTGTKDVLFQSAPQTFAAGSIYSLVVVPSGGGKLANALLLLQGQGGTGTLLANPSGRIKAVNAVPDSNGFNFKADGTMLLSNVPFGGSSSYVSLATGARTLQLEASNVPGTNVATLPLQVDPARDYTAVAVNSLAQAQLVTFADDNSLPATGFAKIRFANALASAPGADVLVNFASQVSGLAYKSASSYYTFAPSLTYTFTFATPGGITVLATLTPVEIDAGAVYTVYLVGTASAPQLRLVRDR